MRIIIMFFAEQNGLSLFKRWIYALQRYKKCYKIHNVPNKKYPRNRSIYVFAWQMQAIC